MKKKERKATGREKVFEERLPKFTLKTTVQSDRTRATDICMPLCQHGGSDVVVTSMDMQLKWESYCTVRMTQIKFGDSGLERWPSN